MNKPSKREFRLFNCDHTYKLDVVEKLVKATESKVGIEFSVSQHYFPLSQMSELCMKTIPELHMDFAMFVVHANESRLSINEDKAGIGYAKVYRALLNATGDKVIIIIGGDDNYKNEDEEDHVVLSRWSRRKISSQFTEEFLDGKKSFVFSWNKKHRPIHEEALLHYFDPRKAGQKFDYQPRRSDAKKDDFGITKRDTQQSSNIKVAEGNASCSGDVGQQTRKDRPIVGSKQEEKEGDITHTTETAQDLGTNVESLCKPLDDQPRRIQELVILGCNTADESLRAVVKVIEDHLPKLNLSTNPSFSCGTPVEMKSYLLRNIIKFCLLILDAETVKATYENVPQLKMEYEELLKTATECVAEMVLVVICGPPLMLPEDEETITHTMNRILYKKEKALLVWLKGGQLQMDSEVFWEILKPIAKTRISSKEAVRDDSSISYQFQPMHESSPKDFVRSKSTDHGESTCASFSHSLQSHDYQSRGSHLTSYSVGYGRGSRPSAFSPSNYAADFRRPRNDSSTFAFSQGACYGQMITSSADTGGAHQSSGQQSQGGRKLPYLAGSEGASDISSGRGSYQGEHQAQGVMTAQTTHLPRAQHGWKHSLPEGELVTLVLKCHLRNGKIAVEEGDFQFPGWKVPDYIAEMLIDKYSAAPEAELLIFFDDHSGELKTRVRSKPKLQKVDLFSGVSRKKLIPQTKVSTETAKEWEELLGPNESLMLKSCVRRGKVSFYPEDVEYQYPNWQVPLDVIKIVEQNEWATLFGELFLISDEKGNLRSLVRVGKLRRIHGFFNKMGHNVSQVMFN